MRLASSHLHFWLLLTVCPVETVFAEQSTTTPVKPASPSNSVKAGGAYVDRVMEGVSAQDETDKANDSYDSQGWARGLSVQFTRNVQTSKNNAAFLTGNKNETRSETQGFQIDTFVEAPNFGTLSLQALALGGSNVSGLSSWTLRQVGMPFDSGWRADNALGTTNLLMPEISRRSSRLTLPGPQVIGASTQWRRAGSDQFGNNESRLGASVGEPGRFEGFPQSRFVGSGGRVSNVFAEVQRGPWTLAATAAEGNNIVPESGFVDSDSMNAVKRISPSNVYLSTAYTDRAAGSGAPDFIAQLSAIGSRADGVSSTGIYADINWRNGAHRHEASAFYLERGLMWLDRALAADLQGAAYRYGYNSTQWDITANVESFDSVSGASPRGWFASGGTRYLLSTKLSAGGGFAVRDFGGKSSSGFGYLQSTNSYGTTRAQVDASTSDTGPTTQALTLEHSFFTETSLSLSTTLSVERIKPERLQVVNDSTNGGFASTQRSSQNAFAVGLNGRYLLTDKLSAQANLRARQLRNVDGRGNNDSTIAFNIGLDWQITPSWSFNASIYENRGVVTDPILVESPLATPIVVRSRPNDRGVFVSLRYSVRAGSSTQPLGGQLGSGTGKIEGTVFLDTNGNGRRDGNESGAANVVVVLDGRYSTRTDAIGNYQFSDVASGPHALTVVQDDLPLPWTMDTDRRYDAPVSTRGTTRIEMGAKRIQ
jgi:SdrD B-like domain